MEKLHPGARWLFRVQVFWAIIFFSIFLGFFIIPFLLSLNTILTLKTNILAFFLSWLIIFIVLMLVGEIWVRMYYNRWLYEFTKTNLKLGRGVIWKRYSNVPYERIQNIDIRRGIIARLFGFSTVDIQTAGFHYVGSRGGGARSEGHIPAVSHKKAEEIRDFLMKKISKKQGQGL